MPEPKHISQALPSGVGEIDGFSEDADLTTIRDGCDEFMNTGKAPDELYPAFARRQGLLIRALERFGRKVDGVPTPQDMRMAASFLLAD